MTTYGFQGGHSSSHNLVVTWERVHQMGIRLDGSKDTAAFKSDELPAFKGLTFLSGGERKQERDHTQINKQLFQQQQALERQKRDMRA